MEGYLSDMYSLCGRIAGARDLETTLNLLVKSITEILGVKASSVRLLDERTQTLKTAAAYGLSRSYVGKGPLVLSENPVEQEILDGKVKGTRDIRKEKAVYRHEAEEEGIRAILNVPLMAGKKAIGILRIYTSEPHDFSDDEIRRLQALASLGGIIADRARVYEELRVLVCIAQSISSTLSLEEVLQLITENAAKSLGMKASSIRLLDDEGKTLGVKAAYGLSGNYLEKGPVEIGKSPVDRECLSGKCAIIPDIQQDDRLQYPDEIIQEGIGAMLSAPLTVRGKPIGVLRVYASRPYDFTQEDLEFLNALASHGAIAIENARLFEHIRKEYDELTKDVWKWYDWGSHFPAV
jgi:GAF domain-containing protein